MDEDSDSSFVRGPLREVAIDSPCPLCAQATLVMRSLPLEIPFFGEAIQTTVLCESCSFRHADFMLMNEGAPVRYELRVTEPPDLAARVVRSSSGTVRIPELGVAVEPGLRAEAFVSNAEGVLRRVRDIAEFGLHAAETPAARRKAERALTDIDAMIAGTRPFTLILEDPKGNSAILHDRATKRVLAANEARKLKGSTAEFRVSG